MPLIRINGHDVEYRQLGATAGRRDTIVMLHEGLGSTSLWREFPEELAAASGLAVLVYSRAGHGRSDPHPGGRQVDFMHAEARVHLPALLDALDVERPWLFGHSDGGSIALIHAAEADRPVAGLIVLAPHVFVEAVTVEGIVATQARFADTDLPARLARHHNDAAAVFQMWSDIWMDPAFRRWNIERLLPRIECPVLAIQGRDDEYGTMEQVEAIGRLTPGARVLGLERCGHSPHRDQPHAVLAATVKFIAERGVAP